MLGSKLPQPIDGRLTLYTGESGSGLTHALENHKHRHKRTVLVDLAAHSHKTALESILVQCGGVVPTRITIGDLTAMAALALAAEKTMLLIDNAHAATSRTHASIAGVYPRAAGNGRFLRHPRSPPPNK